MEVVLLENIKNLGQIGDVVKVKRGHGRNFLIKFGKALKASKTNIDLVNKKKIELNEKNIELKRNAKKIYDVINLKKYKFSKLSLFQKPGIKFFRACPLSEKDAPVVDYKNIKLLKKYLSESKRILPSRITSVSLKKQKELSRAIKRARSLALI